MAAEAPPVTGAALQRGCVCHVEAVLPEPREPLCRREISSKVTPSSHFQENHKSQLVTAVIRDGRVCRIRDGQLHGNYVLVLWGKTDIQIKSIFTPVILCIQTWFSPLHTCICYVAVSVC